MKLSGNALLSLALVAGFVMIGLDANAAAGEAGGKLLSTVQDAITGNLGLVIGLALAILGIWTWVVKQETAAGIFLIIGGVLITISPGVFNSIRSFVDPVVEAAGSSLTDTKAANEVR